MARFISQIKGVAPPWLLHTVVGSTLYWVYYPIAQLSVTEVQFYQHFLMMAYSVGSIFLLYHGYRWITVGLNSLFPRKKPLGTRLWMDTLVIFGVSQLLLWSGYTLVRWGICPFAEIPDGIQASLWYFGVVSLLGAVILALGVQLWHLNRQASAAPSPILSSATGALAPHFLFNALSGLLDLLNKRPESAHAYVHDLSELYAHLLRHRQRIWTSVAEEIQFVQAYLRLIERRCAGGIQAQIAPELVFCDAQVPPLCLHTLVENVVKHTPMDPEHPVRLEIYRTGDQVTVKNSRPSPTDKEVPEGFRIGTAALQEQFSRGLAPALPVVQITPQHYQVSLPLHYPSYANSHS
ncbi:MAG: histidine kinase [Bacteroidota bacterium]